MQWEPPKPSRMESTRFPYSYPDSFLFSIHGLYERIIRDVEKREAK